MTLFWDFMLMGRTVT